MNLDLKQMGDPSGPKGEMLTDRAGGPAGDGEVKHASLRSSDSVFGSALCPGGRKLGRKSQRGFTLIEAIVVLALLGAVIAGVLIYQASAERANRANATISALTTMVGSTRAIFGPANTFAGLSAASMAQAGIPVQPFSVAGTGAGSTVLDPWGGNVLVTGGPRFFGVSFAVPDRETCVMILSAIAPGALRATVWISTGIGFNAAGVTPEAFLHYGGHVVKANAGSPYQPDIAAAWCAASATPHIAFVFR